MVEVRIDGAPVYLNDDEDPEIVALIEKSIQSLPIENASKATETWLKWADFRHGKPRAFTEVTWTACVWLVGNRRIDFSKFMHDIFKARFGEYQGEKLATSFDYLIETFCPYTVRR